MVWEHIVHLDAVVMYPSVRTAFRLYAQLRLRNEAASHTVEQDHCRAALAGFRDLCGVDENQPADSHDLGAELLTGDDEWRYPEYQRIRETPQDDYLTATDLGLHTDLRSHFGRIRSVDVLRETRALRGFTRVRDDMLRLTAGKSLLRRSPLPPNQDWLPAYVVKGEGIYLELHPQKLAAWEARAEVQARADKITEHYGDMASQRGIQVRGLPARFVLLHTLGHLLINELIFACGYSSASLRERLYVSDSPSVRWLDFSSIRSPGTPKEPWAAWSGWLALTT